MHDDPNPPDPTAISMFQAHAEPSIAVRASLPEPPTPKPSLHASKLGASPRNDYDRRAAYVLSFASTWAYSDSPTFREAMLGIGWEDVAEDFGKGVASKTIQNDVMFVKTTVSFLQRGDVGILCFRGTEPTNVLQWLADMSSAMVPFYQAGNVHPGFYRSLEPALEFIHAALTSASHGEPAKQTARLRGDGGGIQANLSFSLPGTETDSDTDVPRMQTLYITGHSLGAALAVLTAAVMFNDPRFVDLRGKLRGVYAFGSPLLGDEQFCATCERQFGSLVFRHVFERDVVASLPSRDLGEFHTFGEERVSTRTGWSGKREKNVRQAPNLIFAVASAGLSWVLQQIPQLRHRRLPYSIADHMPNNYMACSRISLPAEE